MVDMMDVEHHLTHSDSVRGKVAEKCKNGLHGCFSMLHLNVFKHLVYVTAYKLQIHHVIEIKRAKLTNKFKVCKSVRHHIIQINQPTRCNNFSSFIT